MARKNQIANGMAATMPGNAAKLKASAPAQPPLDEIRGREPRCDDAHEHAQLEDRDQRHDQLEARRDRHAGDVERHEDDVGAERDPSRLEHRKLDVDVGADRQRDRRRREHEFDQGREAGEIADGSAERAPAVLERPAGVRDRGCQLGEAEDEGRVRQGDEPGSDEKAERSGRGPAIAPAEILAGDDQTYRDAP